ncbi:MAG: glycoside hydrolase [Candidatus Melainabacteria bacterium HGW-Melainabacteria-1]|nr:MAG: glycoside hydrolase [Candidatus Melainabacteria bacterium HGW-Melainabacteria-1]
MAEQGADLNNPLLIPQPRKLDLQPGHCILPACVRLHLQTAELLPLGQLALHMLAEHQIQAQLSANPAEADAPLRLWLNPALGHAEGYQLSVSEAGIALEGQDQAGLFYGLMTLKQLLRQYAVSLPCLSICDWPDFAARGVMLDISRDKVPTLDTLKTLIDHFGEWKLNQLQLYTEHTFAYAGHEVVWAEASPITSADLLELDQYCAERFIELVPNQNSFGHLARWLKHEAYLPLSETGSEGFIHPWTNVLLKEPFSLCPSDPGSLALVEDLYAQLLPHFRSKLFNIGADETFDLGQGRSKSECEARGKVRVYLDFVRQLHQRVMAHGRLMQFWGDIILKSPELISELPRPCIALNWGYEANHPFDAEGACFAKAGIPYYVCPGTSAWNTIGGRSDNMQANLRLAASAGLSHGAAGYLITDWGDNGHWQPLPVSLPGFAYGAAMAWSSSANHELALGPALDQHLFLDPDGQMAEAWLELGTVYRLLGIEIHNQSPLFALLHWHQETPGQGRTESLHPESLAATEAVLNTLITRSEDFASLRPDAGLLQREFKLAAGLMRHSCRLASARISQGCDPESLPENMRQALATELNALLTEYRQVWLARNRPGGLDDSLKVLNELLERYGVCP